MSERGKEVDYALRGLAIGLAVGLVCLVVSVADLGCNPITTATNVATSIVEQHVHDWIYETTEFHTDGFDGIFMTRNCKTPGCGQVDARTIDVVPTPGRDLWRNIEPSFVISEQLAQEKLREMKEGSP